MVSYDGAAIQMYSRQINRIHRFRQDFSSPACSLCTVFLFSYAFSSDFLEFYMNLLYSSHTEKSINISPKKIPVSISASRYFFGHYLGHYFGHYPSFSSHSFSRNPVRTKSSPITSGRLTNMPSVARSLSCSSSVISESLSLRFICL